MKGRTLLASALGFILAGNLVSFGAQTMTRARRAISEQGTTIPADTLFHLKLNTALSSKTARVGDPISATVTAPVVVDGSVAVPDGSKVTGKVTSVQPAQRRKNGTIGVAFTRLELPDGTSRTIVGSLASLSEDGKQRETDAEGRVKGKSTTKRNVIFIGGGAGVGAAIGAAAGGGKGAGIGAAIGAGVGAAGALLSKGHEAEVASGTAIGMRLDKSVTVPKAR